MPAGYKALHSLRRYYLYVKDPFFTISMTHLTHIRIVPAAGKLFLSAALVILALALNVVPGFSQNQSEREGDRLKVRELLRNAGELIGKPGETKSDLDGAEKSARAALQFSERINYQKGVGSSMLTLSKVFKERKDSKNGLAFLNKALKVFGTDSALKADEAEADMEMAGYFGMNDAKGLEKKISLYERATALLSAADPKSLKLADALKYLGDLYNVKEDNTKSIARLQQAIVLYKALNYDKLQDIYCLLGGVLNRNGASREGIKYLLLAEKAAIRYRDSSPTVTTMYNRMGNVYNSLNQLPEANRAFQKSMKYARLNRDNDAELMVGANLGWSYIRINQPDKAIRILKEAIKINAARDTAHHINLNTTLMEAYMFKHDAASALKCNAAIKNMVRQFYLYDFLLVNYHHAAARLFLMTRDFAECQTEIDALRAISKRSKNINDMAGAENVQYQLDSASNRPWDALNHLNRYKQLNDSLNRRNHDRELTQLEIEYNSEKKDLDIASLRQRSLLQERTLNSEKLVRKLSVFGMLLFVLLTFVLLGSYRLKQKTNRELQNKQNAINGQNLSLKQLLKEREWLVREVHHRVKNNLQIVISLLDSQSSFLMDDNALGVLRESRHRMHSISLVHQKLYKDENLTGINIKDYTSELVGFLRDSFGTGKTIRFEYDVPPLFFDVSQVVPLGLIINEAVTNSIKYAFKNQSDCVITIRLTETDDNLIEVSIADNGCGLPPDYDFGSSATLGMNLISGLTKQLQGELTVITSNGLTVRIHFRRLKTLDDTSESSPFLTSFSG